MSDGYPRRICMTYGVDYIIRTAIDNPKELFGIIKKVDGGFLTPIQCYNFAVESKEKGYKVLPMCDNVDEKGYCQGHEIKDEVEN